MNTPKKFRVWDINNKKFLPESHFAILGNGKLIVTDSGYYEHFTNTNQDDYAIQEYTDIDGKPPCKFDHNAECLICDCWAIDCPFIKLSGV